MRSMAMVAAFLSVMGLAFLLTHEETWIQQRVLRFVLEHSLTFFYLLLVTITVFVFFLIFLRAPFLSQKKKLAEVSFENLLLNKIQSLVVDGLFFWRYVANDTSRQENCSRRLATLLGLYRGTASDFSDIISYFDAESAATIKAQVSLLHEQGLGFSFDATANARSRRFSIRGERVLDDNERVLADLLWIRDVTEERIWQEKLETERHSLIRENLRLRYVHDSLPFPIWMRSIDLNLIYCNHAYARVVGMSSPSAVITDAMELLAGAQVREARTLAIRARAVGEARSDQFHLVVNEERRLMEITEVPLRDMDEGERVTIGFAVDRTYQEELEDTLKKHIAAHATVLENLTTAIAIFSKDTRLVFFNAAFSRLWNVNIDWLSSQPTYGYFLDMLRELRYLPEVVDYRAFRNEELKLFHSLITSRKTLLHLPNGKALRRVVTPHPFGGLLMTYEDVTDSLALTSSYNALIAVQRAIIDSLHEGVAVFGSDGRLTLFNSAYARLWGFDEYMLVARPHINEMEEWAETLIDETQLQQKETWRRNYSVALAASGERRSSSGRLERVDGKVFNYICVPLPDGAVLTLWLDISASVQMEKVLWKRNEILSRDNYLKASFLSAISRELRAPLDTIITLSEALSAISLEADRGELQIHGRNIADAGKTLVMLVDNILDLTAGGGKRGVFQPVTADIAEILTVSTALARETAEKKNVGFKIDCPDDVGRMIMTELRFKLAIFAIVNEILTLTRQSGQITLSGRWYDREKTKLVLIFSNTGDEIHPMKKYNWHERSSLHQVLLLMRNLIKPHGGSVSVFHNPEEREGEFRYIRVVCHILAASPDFSLSEPVMDHDSAGRTLLQ